MSKVRKRRPAKKAFFVTSDDYHVLRLVEWPMETLKMVPGSTAADYDFQADVELEWARARKWYRENKPRDKIDDLHLVGALFAPQVPLDRHRIKWLADVPSGSGRAQEIRELELSNG